MSPHAVNNFVTDLVEMAKAMEELPQVRTALAEAQAEAETQRHTISLREESILRLKAEIEALNDRNHKLEAERDDAELRFLELEEKHGGLTKLIQAAASAVGMVDKPAAAPVMQEPKFDDGGPYNEPPMPAGDMAQPQGQSATDPTTAPTPSSGETQLAGTSGAHSVESTSTNPLPPAATGTTSPSPDAPSAPAAPASDASEHGGSVGKYAAAIWSELSSAVHDDFWRSLEIARSNGLTISAEGFWYANGGSSYGWHH